MSAIAQCCLTLSSTLAQIAEEKLMVVLRAQLEWVDSDDEVGLLETWRGEVLMLLLDSWCSLLFGRPHPASPPHAAPLRLREVWKGSGSPTGRRNACIAIILCR